MARCSNEQVAKMLASGGGAKEEDVELNRKIALLTQDFPNKYCKLVLSDRNRLSKQNALTVCDYILSMKREINPRLTTINTTIQFLSGLSKFAGVAKRFEDMMTTRQYCYPIWIVAASQKIKTHCTSGLQVTI
jgi:hypothetical protein